MRGRMEPDGLYVPVRVPWLPDLKAELLAFPRGRNDDIVDALGLAGQLLDMCNIGSFVRNRFGIKSEDQAAVAHNEASVEPPAPKTKPATSKPKHPAVAAAGATQPKSVSQPGPSAEPQKTSGQPRKKAKQPAGQNEKAHAKRKQEAPPRPAPPTATRAPLPNQPT